MTSILSDRTDFSQAPVSFDEKKENVFVEPQTSTKTSRKPSGSALVESQQNMGPLTTPTKGRDTPACDPWTPTSNLKMLISAASPEIRNREKELCEETTESEEQDHSTQESRLGEESEKLQISRKEKSLGLLCHKFLARYPDYPNPALNNDICLDDVATELNVERRRIYDIMNVLESLHMVSRLAKNRYTWHGRADLPETLALLRKVGEEHRYGQQMHQIRQRALEQEEREFDLDGEEKENEEVSAEMEGEQKELCFVELPGVEFKAASVNSRKDKSLRVMSQKFVMLFLVSTPRVVSLEVAAKILIGEDQVTDQDKSKFKTKIRRLYDIANVLSSLELIKKVHVTEERGRKPAFKWTGPEDLPSPKESTTLKSTASVKRPLESRSSIDNCAKNLFSSPGTKRGFTRHHSLVKLAKSIQDDRRKISSAPSSPIKNTSNDSLNAELYPSKMEQLATICKIQLDEQSKDSQKTPTPSPEEAAKPVVESAAKSSAVSESVLTTEPKATPAVGVHYSVIPPGAVSYLPTQCSPLIPVLLPQHQAGPPYAVYMHPASLRPHPPTRPEPTSLAVRSMTFESPGDPSIHKSTVTLTPSDQVTQPSSSPFTLKRLGCELSSEGSPSKVKRTEASSKDASPKLGEILQARLKARRGALVSSRPSPRALHLDPEFAKTPENRTLAPGTAAPLEHSVETFLEREEKVTSSESEARLTPHISTQAQSQNKSISPQEVVLPQGQLHTETLIPAGYLIPIPQQSLLSHRDMQCPGGDTTKASTPTYNVHRTPTAGSRPPLPQEFTPTSHPLHRVLPASPFTAQSHRLHSPSPAILNFTLQNLGLIPSGATVPGSGNVPGPATPDQVSRLPSPHPMLPQRGMIFIKPISPAGTLQTTLHGQPVTLISVQQPLVSTPKGNQVSQHSFFHTPVSSLSTLTPGVTPKTLYIPQRRLEVNSEDN